MTRERKGKRRYSWASLGISMAFAVVACSLSTSSAKAAAFEINVTLAPGEKYTLGDWVAQQPLDVTGASPCGEKTKTSRWPSETRTRNFRSQRLQNDAWLRLAAHLDNLGALLEPSGKR